jgi:FAD/FMN-containing dehydrogenase
VNAPSFPLEVVAARPGDPALAQRRRQDVDGEVLFDAASRGRYSTDASIYQIEPIGVVVPRSAEAARAAIAIAARAACALRGTTTPIGSI